MKILKKKCLMLKDYPKLLSATKNASMSFYNQQIVNLPQVVERLYSDLFSIPWGHHRYIIDKCSNDADSVDFKI